MKSAYIDYSMSVIISRALPDVRDGLKPVHRRVLFGMSDLGLTYNKSYKKSARIVGEVLGKYHPHGDSSVYDTMVRMAQPWSLRYPLVDGQGNFGSMDGDSPAAMRYTEARLQRIADEMLADINKETVDFQLNFDDSTREPIVLPAKIPNLLVNGASGIAVGMATNMLPHNLTEVVEGILATLENPEISVQELAKFIKAPDFPTGGIIYGLQGALDAFATGRGRIVVRAKAEIQTTPSGGETIVITEIPYQVNKASLIVKMAEMVTEGRIDGVRELRDESAREEVRIVVEVKNDAIAQVVLSQFYKYTPLQTSYSVNNVALVRGRPRLLNLKDMIEEFIKFRLEVVVRRTRFDLRKALERAHLLVGLLIALDYLDAVIHLIRSSETPEEARNGLMAGDFIDDREAFWTQFRPLIEEMAPEEGEELEQEQVLTEVQARAILDMRLQKLTGLEREKVREEYEELKKQIERFRAILASEELQREIIQEELVEVRDKYGDERRTEISVSDSEISLEDLIKDEEVIITISHLGYIKRTSASEYRRQSRGGRGASGVKTRDTDFIEHLFLATNHNYLMFFTEAGKCYWLRAYEIPEAGKNSSGRAIQNILSMSKEDRVKAYIIVKDLADQDFLTNHYILFATRNGMVKKTLVEAFSRPRRDGIIAISIKEGDQLLEARLTDGKYQVVLASRSGYAIRFEEEKVRSMGRTAAGVRGMALGGDPKNAVVGMIAIDPSDQETAIMVISEKGNGKRSQVEEYRLTNRGGKGVKTMQVTQKTGSLVAIKAVKDEDDLMIINRSGISIRLPVSDIRVMGRATQGVRVIRLDKEDKIADVTVIPKNGDEEVELEEPESEE